jgi:hypothetical protein
MAVQIPNNLQNAVTFDFGDTEFTLSAPRWNPRGLLYSVDLSWGVDEAVLGMAVAGGTDLLANIPYCPLPNLWAFNETNFAEDLSKEVIESLAFVVI